MVLKFYTCSADRKRVNKLPFLSNEVTLTIDKIDSRDLINPSFTIINNSSVPLEYNYAYCPDLGRYYFVNSQIARTGNKVTIQCTIDVRMSWIRPTEYNFPLTVLRGQFSKSNVKDSKLPINPSFSDFEILPIDSDEFVDSTGYFRNYEVLEIVGGVTVGS